MDRKAVSGKSGVSSHDIPAGFTGALGLIVVKSLEVRNEILLNIE